MGNFGPESGVWWEDKFRVGPGVALAATAISLLSVLAFGLTPALRASRADLTSDLKQGGARGAGSRGLRSGLVVAQIAISLCLLVSALLMVERSMRMHSVDAGFATENLLVTSVKLPAARYPEAEHRRGFQRQLVARLEALSGVRSASAASAAPFGWYPRINFTIRGRPVGPQEQEPAALGSSVDTWFFETLGLRLLQGRTFVEGDREGSVPVVIVDAALARRHFGDQSPLGEHLIFPDGEAREVVGVVANVSQFREFDPLTELLVYEPYAQRPLPNITVLIRTEGSSLSLGAAVRREIRSLDPLLPASVMRSMEERIEISLWNSEAFSGLLATVAVIALFLSTVGVYAVVNYATTQRTGEFGIRAALGADPRSIARLVLRQAGVLVLWGVSIGLLLALAAARLLASNVYDMEPFDPLAFAGLSLLLACVALAASVVPALRAARADPMLALQAGDR